MTETAISPPHCVTLRGVIKQFGRFAALRGVDADFEAGKFYAVLGDNGAGKTTLLRALAGLARPTRGEIAILGQTPKEACRDLGYMAHPSLLYDELSGLENLRYFASLYGISDNVGRALLPASTLPSSSQRAEPALSLPKGVPAPHNRRCEQVIEAVGLDPALARPVGQYSQGMRQRMSLARAILHDPKILLLDEPFSNVDATSAREMVGLLKQMSEAGKTIFVVTHQASLLEGVADEFIWMQAGQIVDRTKALRSIEQ